MMDAIYFGDKINQFKEKLRLALIQSGQFYDLLCSDFIPLRSIENLSLPMLKLKEDLEKNLIELFQINQNDLDLQYLASIYVQVLDFQNRKIPELQSQAFHNLEYAQKQSKLKQFSQPHQNHLSGKSCVIFSSLLQQDTYVINFVSNSFSKVFGVNSDLIIGKSINALVPTAIKKDHNKMIQNFIDYDSINIIEKVNVNYLKKIIQKGERYVFALDHHGFTFPISLRVKIEYLIQDVGACLLIQKINNYKSYILFDQDGNITDFSKKFYKDIFQASSRQTDENRNIFNMIPNLQNIMQKKQVQMQHSSILIVNKYQDKKTKHQSISDNLIQTPSNKQNSYFTQNDDIFIINFKVCQNQTKINVNLNYIEIDNYEKETNHNKKNKIIEELNKQQAYMELQNNLNKQLNKNMDSFQYNIYDQQNTTNLENNSSLYKNQKDGQNQFKKKKWNSYRISQQEIKESEQIITLNQDQKEEVSIKSLWDQSPIKYSKRLEYFENPDSTENINLNGDSYELTSFRNYYANESKQIGLHKMIQILNNNNNNNTINSYLVDNNQSNYIFSYQKQSLLTNDQYESNLINTGNSKYYLEQPQHNHFDFSNYIQYNYNVPEQKQQTEEQTNKNINQQHILDSDYRQKIYSQSENSLSIEDDISDKKKNKGRDQMEREEQNFEQKNEIASVNSSKYSSQDRLKRNMINRIKEKKFAKSLKVMIISGFIALFSLIITTVVIYFQNINSLDNFVNSFLKIDNPIFCFIDVMKILDFSNYQILMSNNTSFLLDDVQLQQQQYIEANDEMDHTLQEYDNHFQQLVLNNDSEKQLNELQNNQFLIQIYPNQFYYSNQVVKDQIVTYYYSLQYTIMRFFYEIVFYVISYQEEQESFIWGNIVEFKSRMKNLQKIVQGYAQQQFNNLDTQQISVITLVSILSFVMIFSIIPLNVYIQIKKEKVMKLFGTFQPSILEFQIQLIELAIFKIDKTKLIYETQKKVQPSLRSSKKQKSIYLKDLMEQTFDLKQTKKNGQMNHNILKQIDQIPKYIRRLQNSRKRSIATFNSLPKFKIIIIILGVIAVLMLCVQPALNILLFNPFQKESSATLQDRITILEIFAQLRENQATHIEAIYCLNIQVVPLTTYYYTYLQNITQQNENTISQLQDLTTNLDIERHNQNKFEDFYKNILNQDVCQVRTKYPQYFNTTLTEETCNRLFNGILKRGLILSINTVFQSYVELLGMYTIQDLDQQLEFFIKLQSSISIIDLKLLLQVITESVDAIRLYQNDSMQEYKNDLQFNLMQLFIVQIFIILLVFLVGWLRLFYSFVDELTRTQNIFKAFHINVLYENDYIQSYFRQMQINQDN